MALKRTSIPQIVNIVFNIVLFTDVDHFNASSLHIINIYVNSTLITKQQALLCAIMELKTLNNNSRNLK